MASLTDVAEALVLDWLLTTGAVTRPTVWYIALCTSASSDSAGGTEVTGTPYTRMAVTFTRSATSPTQGANNANIEYPTATASWGTITDAELWDAPTGGRRLAFGQILNPVDSSVSPQTIATGNIFRWNAADFIITLD